MSTVQVAEFVVMMEEEGEVEKRKAWSKAEIVNNANDELQIERYVMLLIDTIYLDIIHAHGRIPSKHPKPEPYRIALQSSSLSVAHQPGN